MGSFLDYGGTLPSDTERPPIKPTADPRGRTGDGFLGLLEEQRQYDEAQNEYWDTLAEEHNLGNKTQYLGEAIAQESMTGAALGMLEDYSQEFDPQFDPTPFIDESWPEWRKEAVMDAKNEKHAQILTDRTERQWVYEQQGEYLGGTGIFLQFAGAAISPETWLLGAGEVTALTKLGLTGAGRIAAGATIGALSNAGQEAAIVANNKSRDAFGIAIAAGLGSAFGAGTSLLDVRALKKAQALDEMMGKDFSAAMKTDLDIATGDIKVLHPHTKSPDAQEWADAAARGEAAVDENGMYVMKVGDNLHTYGTKAEAVAAHRLHAQNTPVDEEALAKQMEIDYESEAARYDKLLPRRKGVKGVSIGLEGRSSKNPFTRWLHHLLTEDSSGTGGKTVATHSGALKADMYAHQLRSIWHVTRHQEAKQCAKETGIKSWAPWDNSVMDKFDDAVIKEVGYRRYPESRPKGVTTPDSINRAADRYGELQTARFNRMKEAGVTGYDTIDPDNLYIKHKWDGVAMSRIRGTHGEQFVKNLLKKAILAGREFDRAHKYKHLGERLTEQYKDRTATYMADAIYQRFTRRPDTLNMARAGWMTKKESAELQRRIQKFVDNPEDLKHVMSAADGKDSRFVNELLSQIELDTNFEIDGIAVRHLLDTNLGSSMDTEIRRSSGKAAMAEMGFANQDEFLEFVEKTNRWSRENLNLAPKDLDRVNSRNYRLWNLMMGENLEGDANSDVANLARGFRKASTLASLNQVGFAQAAETGRLVGAIGVRQFIKQIPQFGNMIRKMKNGTFKDPMLNDIEAAFGLRLGDNEILNHPMLLADAGGVGLESAEQRTWVSGLDTAMNKGLHVQGYINGMNYIMKAQHRMHARGFMDNLWRDVQKLADGKIGTKRMRRYADMGLSEDDLKAIKSQFDEHVEMGEGWFGQTRPINMHLVKMAPEIREKLALSYWKNQSQVIQRSIGGETAWWMEGTVGKLFSQFRTFPLVAIEKQTLHDLKHADVEALLTGTASLGFASLAYTAKTYANSFGLDPKKRKQYLKNRLSPEKIAAGAISWAGQANILPDVARTAGDFGVSNPFQWSYQKGQAHRQYYRAKGLDLGTVGAAGSLVSNAYRFSTGLGLAATGKTDFRKDIFSDGIRTMPFGNHLVIKALENYAIK